MWMCVVFACKSQLVIYRAETYGPVYRLNILNQVALCVTCPEATKVKVSILV